MKDESQTKANLSIDYFFERNPVFTTEGIDKFLSAHRSGNSNTRKALLSYYKKRGRILSIRRGLYATIPKTHIDGDYPIDPYLLASRMAHDAVLSHHTALELLGKAYSVTNRITYYSGKKSPPLDLQGMSYQRVKIPEGVARANMQNMGIITINRNAIQVSITGYERSMVDVLDRPDLCGSWEEIWRSLESIEFFDLDLVFSYLSILNNAAAASRVGFFLEQHKNALMVGEDSLKKLEKMCPKNPHYLDRAKRKNCRLLKRWNLLVPEVLLTRSWGEVL